MGAFFGILNSVFTLLRVPRPVMNLSGSLRSGPGRRPEHNHAVPVRKLCGSCHGIRLLAWIRGGALMVYGHQQNHSCFLSISLSDASFFHSNLICNLIGYSSFYQALLP